MKEFVINKNGINIVIILEEDDDMVNIIVKFGDKKSCGYLEKDYVKNIPYIRVCGEVAEDIKKIANLNTKSYCIKITISEELYREIENTKKDMIKEMENNKINKLKEQLKNGVIITYKQETGFNGIPIREWCPHGSLELEKYGVVSRKEVRDFLNYAIKNGWVKEIKEKRDEYELTHYEVILTEERLEMMRSELYSTEKEKEKKKITEFYKKLLDNEMELLKYIFGKKIYVNEDMYFADFTKDPADAYEWCVVKKEFESNIKDIAKFTIIHDENNNPYVFYFVDEKVLNVLKNKYKDLVEKKRKELEDFVNST